MERQVIQEFIEIYRSEPSLWKVRSTYYNNKIIKSAAYRRMVQKLRELFPNADLEMVKRKINALRTNYRKELRKVEASRTRNQLTGEPVYIPSLWYYDLFHFIAEQENEDPFDVSETVDVRNMLAIDYGGDVQYDGEDMSDEFEEEFQISSPESQNNSKQNHQQPPYESSQPSFKRKRNQHQSEGSQSPCKTETAAPDSEEVFGRYVACKLRQMGNLPQRLLSERLISEVLFRGQMGLLTRNTCLNSDEPQQPITVKVEE